MKKATKLGKSMRALPDKKRMPTLQVQQKTQFRSCKDFLITDFRPVLNKNAVFDDKSLDEAIYIYCTTRFPGLWETLTNQERRQLFDEMVLPIFAHRKNKGLEYLKRYPKEVFTVVNEVCEAYSD